MRLDIGANKYDLVPLRLPALKASMATWQTGLAERGWNSLYLGNHDQPRSVSRFGDDSPAHRMASAKTLATVLHLHRGTPYVYQGDELGMANAPFTAITDFRDIQALRFYAEAAERGDTDLPALLRAMARMSRDQGRTPVQWDASPGAGFTTGTPWLAINPDHTRSTRPPRSATPARCSSTTAGSSPCATPTPWSPTASSSSCCRTTRRSGPSSAGPPTRNCWSRPTSPPSW